MMMMLLHLHAMKDDVIDDEKNFLWFIDMPVSVPDADDVAALSLTPDDVVLGYASRILFSLREGVEIL